VDDDGVLGIHQAVGGIGGKAGRAQGRLIDMTYRIELVSDTVTQPEAAMRGAMAGAEVGDEQREGDPTSDRLCAEVAFSLQ
jgi:hypothetical protein